MPPVHRQGDPNTGDGLVMTPVQSTVFANDKLVSVDGSPVTGHLPPIPPHVPSGSPKTANGSSTVFIGGVPVNRQGDPDTCAHPRDAGSPDVFVG